MKDYITCNDCTERIPYGAVCYSYNHESTFVCKSCYLKHKKMELEAQMEDDERTVDSNTFEF